MKQTVRDAMTQAPATLPLTSSVFEAARTMRDADIGDVIVTDEWGVCGIVTDRDLVVRALAEGRSDAPLGDICSRDLVTASPDDDAGHALDLMRENAVRRVVVMSGDGKLVGIVSLGDLAVDRDEKSVLSQISAAKPNR